LLGRGKKSGEQNEGAGSSGDAALSDSKPAVNLADTRKGEEDAHAAIRKDQDQGATDASVGSKGRTKQTRGRATKDGDEAKPRAKKSKLNTEKEPEEKKYHDVTSYFATVKRKGIISSMKSPIRPRLSCSTPSLISKALKSPGGRSNVTETSRRITSTTTTTTTTARGNENMTSSSQARGETKKVEEGGGGNSWVQQTIPFMLARINSSSGREVLRTSRGDKGETVDLEDVEEREKHEEEQEVEDEEQVEKKGVKIKGFQGFPGCKRMDEFRCFQDWANYMEKEIETRAKKKKDMEDSGVLKNVEKKETLVGVGGESDREKKGRPLRYVPLRKREQMAVIRAKRRWLKGFLPRKGKYENAMVRPQPLPSADEPSTEGESHSTCTPVPSGHLSQSEKKETNQKVLLDSTQMEVHALEQGLHPWEGAVQDEEPVSFFNASTISPFFKPKVVVVQKKNNLSLESFLGLDFRRPTNRRPRKSIPPNPIREHWRQFMDKNAPYMGLRKHLVPIKTQKEEIKEKDGKKVVRRHARPEEKKRRGHKTEARTNRMGERTEGERKRTKTRKVENEKKERHGKDRRNKNMVGKLTASCRRSDKESDTWIKSFTSQAVEDSPGYRENISQRRHDPSVVNSVWGPGEKRHLVRLPLLPAPMKDALDELPKPLLECFRQMKRPYPDDLEQLGDFQPAEEYQHMPSVVLEPRGRGKTTLETEAPKENVKALYSIPDIYAEFAHLDSADFIEEDGKDEAQHSASSKEEEEEEDDVENKNTQSMLPESLLKRLRLHQLMETWKKDEVESESKNGKHKSERKEGFTNEFVKVVPKWPGTIKDMYLLPECEHCGGIIKKRHVVTAGNYRLCVRKPVDNETCQQAVIRKCKEGLLPQKGRTRDPANWHFWEGGRKCADNKREGEAKGKRVDKVKRQELTIKTGKRGRPMKKN